MWFIILSTRRYLEERTVMADLIDLVYQKGLCSSFLQIYDIMICSTVCL